MKPRHVRNGIDWVGAIDWHRRLFDSLIPLPNGTSYNAYLVRGADKTALIDTVDPTMTTVLLQSLAEVPRLDYIVSQHTEQDHSGSIPAVLARYPEARVVCTSKAKPLLADHLGVSVERLMPVEDGATLALGGKTLRFVHIPWVHWPETMATYLPEDKVLFTCDFMGSHFATTSLYSGSQPDVVAAAKSYFAEIMMHCRKVIPGHLKKLQALDFDLVAPSHGPMHDQPKTMLGAYEEWSSEKTRNLAIVVYVSMHGSVKALVDRLTSALAANGVQVALYDLSAPDLDKLATSLVDASTLVLGTPAVCGGVHPAVAHAAMLANMLRAKARYAAVIGSFGWGAKLAEQVSALIPDLKVEVLGSALCKGYPKDVDFTAVDQLAEKIREKHAALA
jgi:flavorubredoxin